MSGYLKAGDVSVAGAGLPTLLNFKSPDFSSDLLSGLVGLWVIDDSIGEDALLKNRVNPSLPLVDIGLPVPIRPGMTLNQSNGFNTGLAETSAMTVALITKRTTARALMVYTGTVAGSPTGAFGIFTDGTAPGLSFRAGARNGAGSFQNANSGNTTASASEWLTVIGAVDTTGVVCGVQNNGVYSEGSSAFTGRTVTAGTLRLGAIGNGTYTADFDALLMAVWDRRLSLAERQEACASLDTWATEFSEITTL